MKKKQEICIYHFIFVLLQQNRLQRNGSGMKTILLAVMYVVGMYYDSLVIAPKMLYAPEEYAVGLDKGDSTEYWRLKRENDSLRIQLCTKYQPWKIKTGATVRIADSMTAGAVGPSQGDCKTAKAVRKIVMGKTPKFGKTKFDRRPPKWDKRANLRVCEANIQNYFYHLGGYASKRTTPEQFELQTKKIAMALTKIDADIYSVCELERGGTAIRTLVDAMNKRVGKERYAFIDNGFSDADMLMVGWIYRVDKVRPYGETYHAYGDTTSHYHYRLLLHGFEHIECGEKLNISLNHTRSKHGSPVESNARRMLNTDSLLIMLDTLQSKGHLSDPDILMVGDYNSHAYEQPIRAIVNAGYADQLQRLDPNGYSYVFNAERGYLDRVFANPSMEAQILKIEAWHINTDAYYSKGYRSKYADKGVIRYADHDPVLISLWLGR